jgi:hypothetical protein
MRWAYKLTWKDHVQNCVPCHFHNVDGHIDPSSTIVPIGLKCMLCRKSSRVQVDLQSMFQSMAFGMLHVTIERSTS